MRVLDLVPSRRNLPAAQFETQSRGVSLLDLNQMLFGRSPGSGTPAGIYVDQAKAESVSAFWRGATIWATAIGSLPITVYEKSADGRKHAVEDPAEQVIWGRPNPEVSRSTFWMDAVLRYAATGDCFLRVVTAPGGIGGRRRPVELWPVETARVEVGRDNAGRKVYVIDGDLEHPTLDFTAGGTMVHVPGPTTTGLRGTSPVLRFARTIGLAIAEEIYSSALLGNGTQMSGYLSTDQPITSAQAEELSNAWDERHKGAENANRTAVMGRGTKWMTTQLNAVDAKLLESAAFSISQIARIFGEPEWMLGAHTKDSSWGSGLEEQFRTFIVLTLADPMARFQETISDELLVNPRRFAEFDQGRLTRGKLIDQVNAVTGLVNAGYDPEESLAMVGLPPITHTGNAPVGGTPPAASPQEAAVGNGS